MDFEDFKRGPSRRIISALGPDWLAILNGARDYDDLREAVVRRNTEDRGAFVIAVKRYAGTASKGERALLLAICLLCDFGHVADKLTELNRAWQNIVLGCDREFRAAIAACIEASP